MTKEIEITCRKCGRKVKTTGSGDFSTFVCELCQEKINIPAYEAEIKELEGIEEATDSQKARIDFLKARIESVNAQIKEEEEAEKEEKDKVE